MTYETLPKRYRIEDPYLDDGLPTLVTYYVVRKTPSGAWIVPRFAITGFNASTGKPVQWDELTRDELKREFARFVLDGDGKRYAHETEEMARYSYMKRKQRQIAHAQRSIRRAENGLCWLRTGRSARDEELRLLPPLSVRPY